MKLTKSFLLSMVILLAHSSFAAEISDFAGPVTEVQVLRVNSDTVPGDLDMKLVLNADGDIVGIKYITPSETKNFELTDLPTGLVLLTQQNLDVVKLTSTAFDPHSGGVLNMVYLNNAITRSYRTWAMEIVHPSTGWGLVVNEQTGRRSFTAMSLKSKKVLGKVVGIDKITVK